MKYQDLGGPTPFNYRPDDDSAKLSTTLTPKVRKKLDKVCRMFREYRKWNVDRDMEKMMMESYLLNLRESMIHKTPKKKSKKKSNMVDHQIEPVEADDENDSGEKLIQIGGIYGFNEIAKSFNQFRSESYNAISHLTERKIRRRKSKSFKENNPRSKKIRKLRSNVSHWSGLESKGTIK